MVVKENAELSKGPDSIYEVDFPQTYWISFQEVNTTKYQSK